MADFAKNDCPECGTKVEVTTRGGHSLEPYGSQREYGKCQEGHELTRTVGPMPGEWQAVSTK